MIKGDVAAERAVLSAICQFGNSALSEVADILEVSSFTHESNQILYRCLTHLLQSYDHVDMPAILSSATEIGLDKYITEKHELSYIQSLFDFPISIINVRGFAAKVRKISIANDLQKSIKTIYEDLDKITGNEAMADILALAENKVLDFSGTIEQEDNDKPVLLYEKAKEFLEHKEANRCEQLGIPTGFPIYDMVIGGGQRRGSVNLIMARPKTGKAQPLTSTVYTPNGKKKIGDIVVGDIICSPHNESGKTEVVAIHPQGVKNVYEVTFNNGDVVECCEDHLWTVTNSRNFKEYTLSCKDLKSDIETTCKRKRWYVRLPKKVWFNKKSLSIDPYIMGCLLGDGSFRTGSVTFTNKDKFIINTINDRLVYGYEIKKKSPRQDRIEYIITKGRTGSKSNYYIEALRKYDLWNKTSHDKFIPKEYLYSSIEDRMLLLAGLMDTDGSIDNNGNAEYTTVSYSLALDIKELIHSLGGITKIVERLTSYTYCGKTTKKKHYRLLIRMTDKNNLFLLPKKKDRVLQRKKTEHKRVIKNISYKGKEECVCITVKEKDGLYITDNYVVTHNSTLGKEVAQYVSGINIPVLIIDTEMTTDDQISRGVASAVGVDINDIETGKFADGPKRESVYKFAEDNQFRPIYHISVHGRQFDNVLSIIRRWIISDVGKDENGKTNECLIIYDYFKLMDQSELDDLAEYQAIGFQLSKLTDFTKKYNVPCLAFVQTNRDGIVKESTDVAAQSDRLIWFCSSVMLFKRKSSEEIAEDGPQNGNSKLVFLEGRFGSGLENDYINLNFNHSQSNIKELTTKLQALKGNSGFQVE